MDIKANDYEPKDIIKFIRQAAGKTQKEFASDIGKSKDWVQSNEIGRSDYKFKDLMELANKNNIEIRIKSKDEKNTSKTK